MPVWRAAQFHFEAALRISEALSRRDPDNQRLAADVVLTEGKLAELTDRPAPPSH